MNRRTIDRAFNLIRLYRDLAARGQRMADQPGNERKRVAEIGTLIMECDQVLGLLQRARHSISNNPIKKQVWKCVSPRRFRP